MAKGRETVPQPRTLTSAEALREVAEPLVPALLRMGSELERSADGLDDRHSAQRIRRSVRRIDAVVAEIRAAGARS